MSDITIGYKGNTIGTMDATGTMTLLTAGKYCEDDIDVAYVKPSGVEKVTFTESDGYIYSNGNIRGASETNQEKYTSQLPVQEGDNVMLALQNETAVTMWCAVALYDTSGTFVSRVELNNSSRDAFYYVFTVPAGTGYIAFTYRTYGTVVRKIYSMELPT